MKSIFALIFGAAFAFTANALPLPKVPNALVRLPATFTANYNFEGIVALSNCSGSLIRFENSKDDDQAMVLTNGHCYEGGFPAPGTWVADQSSHRSFKLIGADGQPTGATVTATKVLYSTMTQTDMTLYQLNETYAQILANDGIHALTLSSQHPSVGQPIEVISGYWLRGYSCKIEAFIYNLHEEDYTWSDSVRYSRPGCEVIGGTSGSPVVLGGTRTVIAVNNTGNEDGEECTINNPCEIDKNGNKTWHEGYSYAQETYWIYSCVGANNQFNLATPGCLLPH